MTESTAGTEELRRLARAVRRRALQMVTPHGFGYLGQALSSAELVAAFRANHFRPGRDLFVCSPGHYIIAAYALAVEFGEIDESLLDDYGQNGAALEAIGTETSPGADLTCGSLAQGLSGAIGFAVADRYLDPRVDDERRVFALISDGELQEGQTWEAALWAANNGVGNLIVLLDANDSQVDGPVSDISPIEPIADKWTAFGWHALDIDGHDVEAVDRALGEAVLDPRPSVIIARTSTVHGLDALPADADGHFIKLPPELAEAARRELEETSV